MAQFQAVKQDMSSAACKEPILHSCTMFYIIQPLKKSLAPSYLAEFGGYVITLVFCFLLSSECTVHIEHGQLRQVAFEMPDLLYGTVLREQ